MVLVLRLFKFANEGQIQAVVSTIALKVRFKLGLPDWTCAFNFN